MLMIANKGGFMLNVNQLLKEILRRPLNSMCRSIVVLIVFAYLAPVTAAPRIVGNNDEYIVLRSDNGKIIQLAVADDDDEDGIDNALEINGFTYDLINGLQEWNGDLGIAYFKTDPLRWSTDGDPYSDFMEVSGVNMPSGVPLRESHPLVAARPVVKIGMNDYDVIPIGEITSSEGGEQSESYTNETSETDEVGGSVSVSASLNPFELVGGEATATYSHTWTSTQSSTNSFGSNWNTTRSSNSSTAARLKLRIYMENLGSATALNVTPTFSLLLGNKTIATITLDESAGRLAPAGQTNSRYPLSGTIAIEKDNANNDIILTMDELKAIQMGAPLGLVVTQVQADVARWNPDTQSFDSQVEWSSFEGEIDPVVVTLKANLGDDQYYYYQVYVGTNFYNIGLTFLDALALVFDVVQTEDGTFIDNRKYPDEWYVTTSSAEMIDEWINLGRPQSLLDFKMIPNTKIALMSPGSAPKPRVDMAIFGSDYDRVYVSAFPGNFPILSVKARVNINGVVQDVELFENDDALYSNEMPFELDDLVGDVFVENARGDVKTVKISMPAFYTSAEDIKESSSLLPNPGAEYFIFPNGDSDRMLKLYCLFYDKAGQVLDTPREYFTLPFHEEAANYVDWVQDPFYRRVHFSKIRINPVTLMVDGQDTTFTEREWLGDQRGTFLGDDPLSFGSIRLSYAHLEEASASIDLSGTPFSLAPSTQFSYPDWGAISSTFVDESRKIVTIKATKPLDHTSDSQGFIGLKPDSIALVYKRDELFQTEKFASPGNALQFDFEGFVNMGEDVPYLGQQATVELWLSPLSYVENEEASVYIVGNEKRYTIMVLADGTIQLRLARDENQWNTFNTHYPVKEGEWIHLAYTFDFNTVERHRIKAYINGNLFQEFKVSGINEILGDGNPGHFTVGSRLSSTDDPFFSASIDELRFWNSVRTAEQIRESMADTLGPDIYGNEQSGLVGYWRFDKLEDLGISDNHGPIVDGMDDVRDYSVNGNHGDLTEYGAGLTSNAVAVEERIKTTQVRDFLLHQNYPNPFNPTTVINFSIAQTEHVKLVVYNVNGQEVMTLVDEQLAPGSYKRQLDAQTWPNGLYFYTLTAGGQHLAKRMLLIK
jgi:hypothetical protein